MCNLVPGVRKHGVTVSLAFKKKIFLARTANRFVAVNSPANYTCITRERAKSLWGHCSLVFWFRASAYTLKKIFWWQTGPKAEDRW